MKVWKYQKEIYDFISNNAKNMTDEEMANCLNEQYKEYDFTQQKVKSYRKNHKMQKEKGEIPPGKMITFLDGNKENCNISNLALIDNEINLELQRKKLRTQSAEITKTGIKVAELAQAVRKRRKIAK